MIVKNEEAVLARCLDSIAGLWDELIIVDTGSTDRTIDIAESYGAKVLRYEWIAPGNKGEARNMGIAAAVSQWIVVIDADEVLVNAAKVRADILASTPDSLVVQFSNFIGGQATLTWRQIRIFKRWAYSYKYREHELPIPLAAGKVTGDIGAFIEHRPPTGREVTKSEPMLARLALDVEENPDDPHPLYFYHRQCLIAGDYRRAIDLGAQYLTLTRHGGFIQADIHGNIAHAYSKLGQQADALKQMHLAAACEPQKREWYYKLAILYKDFGLANVALAMLRAAAELLPTNEREWEPQTTAKIYDLMDICKHEQLHQMAHSH